MKSFSNDFIFPVVGASQRSQPIHMAFVVTHSAAHNCFVGQLLNNIRKKSICRGYSRKANCSSSHSCVRSQLGWESQIAKVATEAVTSNNPLVIQRVADYFKTLGIPESLEKYGHPVMMAVMITFLGGATAYYGW